MTSEDREKWTNEFKKKIEPPPDNSSLAITAAYANTLEGYLLAKEEDAKDAERYRNYRNSVFENYKRFPDSFWAKAINGDPKRFDDAFDIDFP